MRIPEKPVSQYPWYLRPLYWGQLRRYGQLLKPTLLWGRSPWVFLGVAMLYGALERKRSPLSPVLRSLVIVRVSQINRCQFCVDINSATLAQRAGSLATVEAVSRWRESDVFDDRESLALEYAEAMTYSDRQVTDELMLRLRESFDEDAIVELTGVIAFQNMSSKFNSALDVPSQRFCSLPVQGPGSP